MSLYSNPEGVAWLETPGIHPQITSEHWDVPEMPGLRPPCLVTHHALLEEWDVMGEGDGPSWAYGRSNGREWWVDAGGSFTRWSTEVSARHAFEIFVTYDAPAATPWPAHWDFVYSEEQNRRREEARSCTAGSTAR